MDKKQGDISKTLRRKDFHWKTSRLWKVDMMLKMARSVFSLHREGLIHRDLKLENFLMQNDFYPILADFGFTVDKSKIDSGELILNKPVSTPGYTAPELISRDSFIIPFSFKSDIYALGICFYRLSREKFFMSVGSVEEDSTSITSMQIEQIDDPKV